MGKLDEKQTIYEEERRASFSLRGKKKTKTKPTHEVSFSRNSNNSAHFSHFESLHRVLRKGYKGKTEIVFFFILIRLNEWESCRYSIQQCLLYFGCLELRLVSKNRYFSLDIIGSVHVQTIQP